MRLPPRSRKVGPVLSEAEGMGVILWYFAGQNVITVVSVVRDLKNEEK